MPDGSAVLRLAIRARLAWWRLGLSGLVKLARDMVYSQHVLIRTVRDITLAPPPSVEPIGPHLYRAASRPGSRPILARRGTSSELRRAREGHPDLPAEFYVDVTHGARCFWLAWVDGELAGIIWFSGPGERPPFGPLRADEREVRKAFVRPPFRGSAVMIAMMVDAGLELRSEGVRWFVGHIRTDNRASLKSVERLWGRATGSLRIGRILGVTTRRFTPFAESPVHVAAAGHHVAAGQRSQRLEQGRIGSD